MTDGVTTRRSFTTINPVRPEDRKTLKTDAKTQIEQAAEVVSAPANRPTAQSALDARRGLRYDPTLQQLQSRFNNQVPKVDESGGTVTITGSDESDRIRIQQDQDQIHAYYTDANNEEQLLGEWNADDVVEIRVDGGDGDDVIIGEDVDDRVTLGGGAGDDRIINQGGTERTDRSATLDGGEGDDLMINTRTGATIQAGAGANEIYNSGDLSTIGGEGDGVDSEDTVFNAADGVDVSYENQGGHQITSLGDLNDIKTAGEGGSVNVVGDQNRTTLNGRFNDVTVQGDENATVGKTGDNSVRVAGQGNGVDLIGTGNNIDINGDQNVVATDNAAGILLDNFDKLDADGDGVLLPEEIKQIPGAEDIAGATDSLMFATIQDGSNAWHGLSREDLQTVADRMYKGESLDQISQDLRENSWLGQQLTASGQPVNADTFGEAVNRYRQDNPRPDVDPMTLTPMLDANTIGVWGDQNLVAAPGPNTWLGYEGSGNTINVGGQSAVAGAGDFNQVNLGGPNSMLAFQGSGNAISSGDGNSVLGVGDFNTIESAGRNLIEVEGNNMVNGQLQTALAPYFATLAPDQGMPPDLLIASLLQQRGEGEQA